MGRLQWPGDKNKTEETRFMFQCMNLACKPGRLKFAANWKEPGPLLVPSGIVCPYCSDEAVWVMDGFPATNVRGKAGTQENPYYSPQLAASEHRWMGMQIEEAKKALGGDEQLEGKGASPYSKKIPEYDILEKEGVVKKLDTTTAEQKKRIIDDRARKVAEQADDKITNEFERKHVGRRHDG